MSWWKKAQPGDQVVCIDNLGFPDELILGETYTIASINIGTGKFHGAFIENIVCIELIETKHPADQIFLPGEPGFGFCCLRFKPAEWTELPASLRIETFLKNRETVPA